MTIPSPLARVLERLDGVRRSGSQYVARCPAHDDSSPSLAIGTGDDGRVLIRCHAGCGAADIVTALGLALRDLYPARDGRPSRPLAPSPRERDAAEHARLRDELRAIARERVAITRTAGGVADDPTHDALRALADRETSILVGLAALEPSR